MDAEEFRTRLENLEQGDTVTFVFKRMVHWATYFLALFNVKPHAFVVVDKTYINLEIINLFKAAHWVSITTYPVVCTVLRKLSESQINMGFMMEYIHPMLNDFIVLKAQKPE